MKFTRTTSDTHKSLGSRGYREDKKRMSYSSGISREEPSFDSIFDRFRNRPGVDMLWVKENIYGTPCIPETCPEIRSITELCGSLSGEQLELEDGELAINREKKRRN